MELDVQFISIIATIIGWGIALHIAINRRISGLSDEFNAMESRLTGELKAMGRKRDTLVTQVREVKGAVETLDADRRREPVEMP